MLLFSIFDLKAASFSPPMAFDTKGLAIRFFEDEVTRQDSRIRRHAADYDLRQVGEFDPQTGSIVALKTPLPVVKAADFVGGANG